MQQKLREFAIKVQRMRVSILQDRAEAECIKSDDVVDIDRSSEMGACMEFDEFDSGVHDGHLSAMHHCIELDCSDLACADLHHTMMASTRYLVPSAKYNSYAHHEVKCFFVTNTNML